MKTTMPVIDAAFEMVAICKNPFPVEGTPEFFALTDAVHKLECACLAYKAELLRPTDGPGDSAMLDWIEKNGAGPWKAAIVKDGKPEWSQMRWGEINMKDHRAPTARQAIRAAMQAQEGASDTKV